MIFLETDDVDLEFTKEEIEVEADLEKLRQYRTDILPVAEELAIMADAFKQGGIEEFDLCYKLGRLRIGLRWIERRMAELGEDDFGSRREKAQAGQIANLMRQNQMLRDELATYKLVSAA